MFEDVDVDPGSDFLLTVREVCGCVELSGQAELGVIHITLEINIIP